MDATKPIRAFGAERELAAPPRTRQAVLFSTLARNQTAFYLDVASELKKTGHDVHFLSFHESSMDEVRARGFSVINAFEVSAAAVPVQPEETLRKYEIEHLNRLISHEKLFYEIRDSRILLTKLAKYLEGIESALRTLKDQVPPGVELTLVQELGGFLSVIAGFYAARRCAINNIFIEPSFYRGRVFFVANSFGAMKIAAQAETAVTDEVRDYLRSTLDQKRIVIPVKDAAHYRPSLTKILSWKNSKRLVQKIVEKYVRGHREEFTHVGNHLVRHLRMARNEWLFRMHYSEIPPEGRVVYYPLHVPSDVALTVRAPEYVDQLALLDFLARSIPITHRLMIKEHPAMIGATSYPRMIDLLKRHDNLVLLNPGINNHDAIRRSDAVVTVNSKSGAEAILLGKPVIALGDSFYRDSGLVRTLPSLGELPAALKDALHASPPLETEVETFFQRVWEQSYPGELYATGPDHAVVFAGSLAKYLGCRQQ